jgi:MYXO-CTERM domain-containing protein
MPTTSHARVALGRRAFVFGGATFAALAGALAGRPRSARAALYGPLVADPEGVLDLPAGFTYRVLDRFGDAMDDGYRVPASPDGMAAFPGPDGTIVLMRNHELLIGNGPYEPGEAPEVAYDPLTMGCVTRLVVDGATYERISSNLVLCGTLVNCAGGPSPWGWLSCEENTTAGHGYVFVCDTAAATVQPPVKIPAFGRFKHEAAAVDLVTGIVYLTEDLSDSSLYRFVPDDPAVPFVGRLQALKLVGVDVAETTTMEVGAAPVAIEWVNIDEPDPEPDNVRLQAQARGAAIFKRGEGIIITAAREVYFTATTGGPIGKGQVFRLRDRPDGSTLEVVAASTDTDILNMPDNITMSPWGELFMCEDGGGVDRLLVLTADGEIVDFARNAASEGELAGVCFSPDGRALFLNLYQEGLTVVITGPFPDAPPPGESDSESDGGTTDDSSGTTDDNNSTTTDGASSTTDEGTSGGQLDDAGCGCQSSSGADALASVALLGVVAAGRRRAEPDQE